MPRLKNPVNFDQDAKNTSFLAATQEPPQRRSTTLKLGHFRQPTQQPNPFHPTLEPRQVRSPAVKSSHFRPSSQKPSQFSC